MEAKMITVRPVDGRRIMRHDASHRAIEAECEVPDSAYYRRAERRGDLEIVKPTKKKGASPEKEG